MSREIKFRAWDNYTSKMLEQMKGISGSNSYISFLDFYYDNSEDRDFRIVINDLILMQFTGLLDKNGKEIFEGDILIFYIRVDADIDDAGQVYKCKGQVIFDNGAFIVENTELKVRPFFYFDWDKMKIGEHCEELSVGGNIYQNPELLGGQDE